MNKRHSLFIGAVFSIAYSLPVTAATEFPVTARLFVGAVSTDPKDVNTEMKAESLKEFGTITQFGAEATYPLAKLIDVGFRYTLRTSKVTENPDDSITDYYADLKQEAVSGVVRVPILNTSIVKLDVFGAVGGTNTTLKIKTLSQEGELNKKGDNGWFGSMVANYGASVAVGYKGFYFVVEGGYEDNKAKDLKRTGTVNTNIETIDISGSYISVGLMFDGVKATKK
ncbi:MAG: hypothetical protein AB7F86_18190 [Bdellovibrionales bacterium]